jgi:RNA polymerase sigma factor for flagellar operon FliA
VSENAHIPSEQELALLSSVVSRTARARRLRSDEARDFAQAVHVRLLESGYAAFRRFEGKATLRTYLTVVVIRLYKDWQNHRLGKWRPSAAAIRIGSDAVELERLMFRDGFTEDQAVETLRHCPRAAPVETLRRIADQLPPRPRRRRVSEAVLDVLPAPASEDPIERRERAQVERRIAGALRTALAQLTDDDRRAVVARFRGHGALSAHAVAIGVDVKRLYRRCDRALKTLRWLLREAGVIGAARVQSAVTCVDTPVKPTIRTRGVAADRLRAPFSNALRS